MVNYTININLPPVINLILVKSKKKENFSLYIYNTIFFLKFPLKYETKYYKIDKETNSIQIFKKKTHMNFFFLSCFYNFLKNWDVYFFLKIKFKGKGYKIKIFKKKKIIIFYFGRSHKTIFSLKKIKLNPINKYKFIIENLKFKKLKNIACKITQIKKISIYTQRGLRISRQIVLKRKGKKSSY